MVKTRTVLIVVLLAASFLLFNAAIRKISSRRAAGAASSAPPGRKCPAVKSCEEQREEKCGASPRKGTTTGGRGGTNKAAGRVLVLAVANQGSDTVRVNIFVRSCRTALVRRGSDADIVVLSDSQAAGDRMEIFRIVGVVEAIYDKPEGSGAGSKWAVLRDYLAGASAEGYTSVMIASSEDDMCQLDPFKVIAKGSEGDIHTFEMSPGWGPASCLLDIALLPLLFTGPRASTLCLSPPFRPNMMYMSRRRHGWCSWGKHPRL